MIDVDYYKFEDGTNPIDPYLDGLDPKMRAKVLRAIGLLEEFGTALRMPHSEHLGDGIFELRVKQGSDIERVLYFFWLCHNTWLILTPKLKEIPYIELPKPNYLFFRLFSLYNL